MLGVADQVPAGGGQLLHGGDGVNDWASIELAPVARV